MKILIKLSIVNQNYYLKGSDYHGTSSYLNTNCQEYFKLLYYYTTENILYRNIYYYIKQEYYTIFQTAAGDGIKIGKAENKRGGT